MLITSFIALLDHIYVLYTPIQGRRLKYFHFPFKQLNFLKSLCMYIFIGSLYLDGAVTYIFPTSINYVHLGLPTVPVWRALQKQSIETSEENNFFVFLHGYSKWEAFTLFKLVKITQTTFTSMETYKSLIFYASKVNIVCLNHAQFNQRSWQVVKKPTRNRWCWNILHQLPP